MIGAVFRGPDRLEVGEMERTEIGPGEVLVKVGANTVCGTLIRIRRGEKARGIAQNVVLDHELAGYVAGVGENVRGYEGGAPVVLHPTISCLRCYYCRRGMENVCETIRIFGNAGDGGLEEYVRVPAEAVAVGNLFVTREDLPSEYLALAETLSCRINGLEKHRVKLDETVLVMGAGPIGLFHLQFSLLAGARTVIVSNPSAPRRGLASDLGATVTVDPTSEDLPAVVAEYTGGLGADVAVICIGKPQLVNEAIRLTRKGGRVNVFAGLAGEGWAEVEANLIHYNELVVTGSANTRRSDFETAMRLIEPGQVEVGKMVPHRLSASGHRGGNRDVRHRRRGHKGCGDAVNAYETGTVETPAIPRSKEG